MISFDDARNIVIEHGKGRADLVNVTDSIGLVLVNDVTTKISLPSFDNSAMDGFAIRSDDTLGATAKKPALIQIRGAIKAGDTNKIKIFQNECYKIMTGAPLPALCDTVLKKENATVKGDVLIIHEPICKDQNIRKIGEEIKRGDRVLQKGTIINPGCIGLLSSIGVNSVKVFSKPSVAVIATGSELMSLRLNPIFGERNGEKLSSKKSEIMGTKRPILSPTKLSFGQIYNSNSSMIYGALTKMGITPEYNITLPDEPRILKNKISKIVDKCDITILMGGVSVGDYDFVKDTLNKIGVREIFWRVKQKPGKPLYFGKKGNHLVFGLPGNPASVFISFYEYVYPSIRKIMGYDNPFLIEKILKLNGTVKRDSERLSILKGKLSPDGLSVSPLGYQKSHMLLSLVEADSLILIPQACEKIDYERVRVNLLP